MSKQIFCDLKSKLDKEGRGALLVIFFTGFEIFVPFSVISAKGFNQDG